MRQIKTLDAIIDLSDATIARIPVLNAHYTGDWIDTKEMFLLEYSSKIVKLLIENINNLNKLDITKFSKYEYFTVSELANFLMLEITPVVNDFKLIELMYHMFEKISKNYFYAQWFVSAFKKYYNNTQLCSVVIYNATHKICAVSPDSSFNSFLLNDTIDSTITNNIVKSLNRGHNYFLVGDSRTSDITLKLNIKLLELQSHDEKFKRSIVEFYINVLM